jgi:hypothetical protein
MSGMAFLASGASERAQQWVDSVQGWLTNFSVGDWVAVALAGAALFWIVAGLRALTRLGPIEIEPLEEEEDAHLPVRSLTAAVARRLSKSGLLSPPEVPAGAPQADFITAVEKSPISQASWIASLMKLVPRPRPAAYKLGGTVITPAANGGTTDMDGISFRLRPVREGHELQEFVPANGDDLCAVAHRVADLAYLHIIEDAAAALPLWARWHDVETYAAYLDGMAHLERDEDVEGAADFDVAAADSSNLLVRVQYANLLERSEAEPIDGEESPDGERALTQARALNAYLRVAKLEASFVEPRYRASVLAAMLASGFDALPETYKTDVRAAITIIQIPAADAAETFADLSRSEANGVLELLRPWFTLVRQGRLRHQLELSGFERSRLRKTVVISKHCVWVREVGDDNDLWTRIRLFRRRITVWLHLLSPSVGWQAHYNAACFYALLHGRAKRLREQSGDGA